MSADLVSVVVPIYNSEVYLSKCVNSILNQTYQNLEVVLVDDGSVDNSGEICDTFAKIDNRVIVIHKKNGGVSSARNEGIQQAHGKYVTFVDSDDYIGNNLVQKMIENVKENVDMVIASIRLTLGGKEQTCWVENKKYTPVAIVEEYCVGKIPSMCFEGPYCKLFKLDVIKKNNIVFDGTLKLCEDKLFNLQYIANCNSIITLKEVHYFHIKENNDSLSTKYRNYNYENIKRVHEYAKNMLKEWECSDEAVQGLNKMNINHLISLVKKSVRTAEKNISLEYMSKLVIDSDFVNSVDKLRGKPWNFITARMILKKQYNFVFYMWKIWYAFHI